MTTRVHLASRNAKKIAEMQRILGDVVPDGSGFPWTTFAINVTGALALALLPVVAAVRRRPVLTAALGPGLLGGYTTLSTYAEQGRSLLADGRGGLARAARVLVAGAGSGDGDRDPRPGVPAAHDVRRLGRAEHGHAVAGPGVGVARGLGRPGG